MPIMTQRAVTRIEFMGVKSRFVWNVKITRPMTTAAHKPAACNTMTPFTTEMAVATAMDSATVNAASSCMFSGDLWRLASSAMRSPIATKKVKMFSCRLWEVVTRMSQVVQTEQSCANRANQRHPTKKKETEKTIENATMKMGVCDSHCCMYEV
jgi:hypothetical protein